MKKFKIALLQLESCSDIEKNLVKGIEYCKLAKNMKADLILFPEMWSNGYAFPDKTLSFEKWKANAIDKESYFFKQFQQLAIDLNTAIGITYLEKYEPLPRNTISIIDRKGNCVLTYAKVHTCDFGNEANCTNGDDFYVCDLDTEKGIVKIGAMICFDREFPESARILMLKGAEIIVIPNACEIEVNRKSQLLSRSFENMVGVALANYSNDKGHSIAFDGMAFDSKIEKTRDMLLVEGNDSEGVFIAEFDLETLRQYRNYEVWGNAYRKTRNYSELLSTNIQSPFIRKDAKI